MAMVIDDRLKVWEDKDQPRVHVVPAFTPYYAPQAEVLHFCFPQDVANFKCDPEEANANGTFFIRWQMPFQSYALQGMLHAMLEVAFSSMFS